LVGFATYFIKLYVNGTIAWSRNIAFGTGQALYNLAETTDGYFVMGYTE
jgi:hypothetical protein